MSPPSVHRSEQQFLVSQESIQQSLCNKDQVLNPCGNKDTLSYPSSNKDQVLNPCGNKDTLSYPSSNKDQVLNPCGNKDTHNDLRSNQDQVNSPCGNKDILSSPCARTSFSGLRDSESRGKTSLRPQDSSRQSSWTQDLFQVSWLYPSHTHTHTHTSTTGRRAQQAPGGPVPGADAAATTPVKDPYRIPTNPRGRQHETTPASTNIVII
ncbi:hypothetical protein ACLKA7_000688 [Drosophila subpalustris]